jgi:glucose/arabinose dehydrogenase
MGGAGGMGGASTTYDCSPPSGSLPALKLTQYATNFSAPLLAIGAPNDTDRLYVVQRTGYIDIVKKGVTNPQHFLDVNALVSYPGEQGLLGLAFHPDYQNNGRFFVYYTDKQGDTQVVEYKRSADPEIADPMSAKPILSQAQPQANHNGGMIAFSPKDGFLYIGLGDGGNANDEGPGHNPQIGNGQDTTTFLGKILRIDIDHPDAQAGTPYSIPMGNLPPAGANDKAEIWDYGVRNPWRYAFDPCNGDLYIGDVGQNKYEEVDYEPAGKGQQNYGWNRTEASHCFKPANGCDMTGITLPVLEYDHGIGCSISGGFVYRGKAIPGLRGRYFFGDYCKGKIWSTEIKNGVASMPVDHTNELHLPPPDDQNIINIAAFGQDTQGEMYVVDLAGGVYRIDAQ